MKVFSWQIVGDRTVFFRREGSRRLFRGEMYEDHVDWHEERPIFKPVTQACSLVFENTYYEIGGRLTRNGTRVKTTSFRRYVVDRFGPVGWEILNQLPIALNKIQCTTMEEGIFVQGKDGDGEQRAVFWNGDTEEWKEVEDTRIPDDAGQLLGSRSEIVALGGKYEDGRYSDRIFVYKEVSEDESRWTNTNFYLESPAVGMALDRASNNWVPECS